MSAFGTFAASVTGSTVSVTYSAPNTGTTTLGGGPTGPKSYTLDDLRIVVDGTTYTIPAASGSTTSGTLSVAIRKPVGSLISWQGAADWRTSYSTGLSLEGSGSVALVAAAPNAPQITAPANNITFNAGATQRFSWTYSGNNYGDSQSASDFRYSTNGSTWSTISRTGGNGYIDVPGGTFPVGAFQWQVRTYSANGLVGPWSSSLFATASTPPVGPTITDPINGQTFGTNAHLVQFSFPSLTSYRYRVLGSDVRGNIDLSNVIVPLTTVSDATSRAFTITGLANNQTIHILLAVQAGGLWSTETESVNLVSYTPPAVPAVSLAENNANASIVVAWATAAGVGETPSATTAEVWISTDGGLTSGRYAKAQAPSGSWTFWTPASGVAYSFRVVAFADNGTWAASPWGDVTGGFFGTGTFGTGVFGEAD